jgi:hypothetical protein
MKRKELLVRGVVFFCAALLLAGLMPNFALAQVTAYGTTTSGPKVVSNLYSIDLTTGVPTFIGPIGFNKCNGLDFDPDDKTGLDFDPDDKTLYATCARADGTPILVTINTTSGAGTEVGITGIATFSDLSFDGTTLFAYDATPSSPSLYTLNKETGAATLVGSTDASRTGGGNAIAHDLTGTLYHAAFPDAWNILVKLSGSATPQGSLNFPPEVFNGPDVPRVHAMDFHPVTGTLYGVVINGKGGTANSFLVIIDPNTLQVTFVGQTFAVSDGFGLGALAINPNIAQEDSDKGPPKATPGP